MSTADKQNAEKKVDQVATDAQKTGHSLVEQGTNLVSDTLAYAQQQASSLLGSAKNSDAAAKVDDASKTASDIADSGAKEGQAQAQAAQHSLAELGESARALVGSALQSANEYIKPQEKGEQAQGIVNNVRATASGLVEQAAGIIGGAKEDLEKKDVPGQVSNIAADVKDTASKASSQAQGTVQNAKH
ncbi:hypothetical protein CBS101457_001538 [Exobasidium rhododendri]|nr:hypothetical protein CBS101457_001538 [Exobasidium rhododendri]